MKKIIRSFISFSVVVAVFLVIATPVSACTGVIVGSDVTEDGSYIFGRTEDLEVNHNKVYKVHPAKTFTKGQTIVDVSYDPDLGYSYTFPKDSYSFTSISDTTPEYGIFDEAGFNEMGLIADMTVSASANDEILAVDPYLDGSQENTKVGITEAIIATVVLSTGESAQDAVKLIASEVSQHGAAEGNGLVVGDHKELWYMEIYSGHQFVAMKYPTDKFSVFPNTFWINEVTLDVGSEEEHYNITSDGNYIYSKDIFKVAKEANKLVGDEEKRIINLEATYAPSELSDGNISRVCSGIKHLNPEADVTFETEVFEFLQTTNKKITLEDVIAFTQNRMENMDVVADDFAKGILYPIGNRNTMEAHIFVVPKGATKEYPGVMYTALGSPLVSPYVAYYPNQTDVLPQAANEKNEYNEDSVYWVAMDVLHMVEVNRDEFMKVVNKHREAAQALLIKDTVLTSQDAAVSTEKNLKDAQMAFDTLKAMQSELKGLYETYLANNDYNGVFKARRRTANFAGAYVVQPKGTAKVHVNLAIQPEEDKTTVTVVDPYGNPMTTLENEVMIYLPKAAFESSVTAKTAGGDLEVVEENEFYVLKTKDSSVELQMANAPTPSSTDKMDTPATPANNALVYGGLAALILGGVIFVFLKLKKTK